MRSRGFPRGRAGLSAQLLVGWAVRLEAERAIAVISHAMGQHSNRGTAAETHAGSEVSAINAFFVLFA